MAEKRIKQLKRQMPLRDGLRAQAYFNDMAQRGLFLDEIGQIYYYFREGEPKEIRYATQVFSDYPTQNELDEIAAKGWKMVCRWEKEYVFSTEDMTIPDLYDHLEIERLEVERQILDREGSQLMEIKYKGNVEVEKILLEINRVFHSQTK